MSADAKQTAIHWRRILFVFHLLVWLIARLAVGSIREMPPTVIYDWLSAWGFVVFGHGLVLAILDGRDQAEPPFRWLTGLIEPRERRWSLLAVNGMLWIISTMAIASRTIPEAVIFQYSTPLALLWLALTGFGLAHVLLALYAELYDRAAVKHKREEKATPVAPLLLSDDGELIDSLDYESADKKRSDRL